ncbi:23S rRNA (uracil(1939)-C(5))-methyltransferase RlmD [Blautia sp. MSK17_66]|uniref:23S rRNA (uracil(1939)-C(5))-methyltransferase RlmD n=1 Tax=Blautia TaxID=572511 RepID=UPI001570E194|nr:MULTISPECIES: 23S rRNA (uracil(1939)-C(5))-methyltransferase RlmD [Blautia]MCB5550052.1 23S rRNA (uracil(1939)-C(5))-methyltransferase RlmD [Blautia sp. MSK17_66]NSK01729.1 23S rRNA (uracil(1939)-C(5))-methyltransferase RlmD [Blautia obeum]
MEYRKNDIVTLEIVDCGTDGEGIGKADGFTVFVKDAVIGDTVKAKIIKAKKNYGYGRLMEIIKPSPYRVEPVCPSARQCGGCQLQAVSYEEQKVFKEKKLRGHLERIGGFHDLPMEPLIGMDEPYHYRNKAQFPVGRNKEGRIITGFYAGRTHAIIENRDCALGIPQNKDVLDRVIAHMEKYNIAPYDEMTGRGLVRHIFVRYGFFTGEIMVCLIINGQELPHQKELIEKLCEISGMTSISLNINKKRNNVILGDKVKTIWGQEFITDKIGDISYEISPLSFFQVNPKQTWKLYSKALEYADLHGEETVWDLYCGIGTISLFLAQKARFVRGVEIVPAAIEDAKRNARINNIENVEFFVGKAEEVLPREYEKNGVYADVIVVDPPRKGCDEMLLKTILKMQPKRVVYVSCDSATLARDLRFLCDNGYELKKVCGVDQFPQTVHVETVVLLSHKKPDGHINVKVEFGEGEGKVPLDNIAKRAESYKPKERVTYKMIKEYIEAKYGFKVHTAYIAEVKRDLGLPMYDAPNAVEELKQPRKHPTVEKVEAIKDALKHFEVI